MYGEGPFPTGFPHPTQMTGFLGGSLPRFSPSSLLSADTYTLNNVPSGQVPCGHCIMQAGTSVPQTPLTLDRAMLVSRVSIARCQGGCDLANNDVTLRECALSTPQKSNKTQTFSPLFTRSLSNPSSNALQFRPGPRVHGVLCGGFLLPLPDRCYCSC